MVDRGRRSASSPRPKPAKLARNLRCRGIVEADLAKKYFPEQIASQLKLVYSDPPKM